MGGVICDNANKNPAYFLRVVFISRKSRFHCMVHFVVQNWQLNYKEKKNYK